MTTTRTKVAGLVAVAFLALGASEALAAKQVTKKQVTGVANLNQATAQQLDLLPGIGGKAAKRIIEHRAKAPFKQVEELTQVKGFGKKKLEKLKPFLTVAGPTTVAVKKVKVDADKATPGATSPPSQGRSAAPAPRR